VTEDRFTTCPRCGEIAQEDDKFCGSCGSVILSPPPRAEQMVPRSEAATHAHGASRTGSNRILMLVGIAIVLVLLLGGGVAYATLGPGTNLLTNYLKRDRRR
jgi:uncharacterized membrane protein YvbJ